MNKLPEYINGVPNICGSEDLIASARNSNPVFLPQSKIDWDKVKSAFAIALHMHQPIITNPDKPLKRGRRNQQSRTYDESSGHRRQS